MIYEEELAAYTAYLNGLPKAYAELDADELDQYLEDMQKSKAAMEKAYLEQIPTKEEP